MSNPQQPYGGGWPGDPNQPPTDPNQQYNLTPPGGASYDVGSPQGFEQAGYGQPDYSGQFNQAEYDQQYSGPGYGQQQYGAPGYGQQQPYGAPGYGPPGYPQPGYGAPGGPPPKKTSWLPWVLGGGGVLALVLVILLVVVLVSNSGSDNNGGGGDNNAQASSGASAQASSAASAPPAGGTYKTVDNLCDVLDTSPLSSIAGQKYGSPSNSNSSYGDYKYITCDVELTNNGTSDLNLVSVDAGADIYSNSSDASSYFDTEYDSAKSSSDYKFKDISGLGEKAYSSYSTEGSSGSYTSLIQEVKVLDGNAEFDVELIMTTSTSVTRDQSEQYATDITKSLMSSLHS